MSGRLRQLLLGKPLATAASIHERLSNLQALAIFGADALSSTAYATEEILLVLAGISLVDLSVATPIAIAIVALILIVAISYRQVVREYPQGGGVFNVARENLGEIPSLVGGASLLIDYVLTAAVSTAAGVAALTSAFPALFDHRVACGIVVIVLLTWVNLRGVRESGRLFAIPTYLFISLFGLLIGYGAYRYFSGTFPVVTYAEVPNEAFGALGLVLILRAFSGGCTALTGIEAISNGVKAFRPPESKNAARVLILLAIVLGCIFLGITVMAHWAQIRPLETETVVSQVTRNLLGSSPLYYLVQWATFMILFLAANTPFADFPRVASQLATHSYFPRQFMNLGSRLVFVNGIIVLGVLAALLIIIFAGDVHALIPLYAVGVFVGFTLSQAGMIVHWRKLGKGHARKIIINGLGMIATFLVLLVILFSKFTHGAWALIPAIVLLVLMMKSIKSHYISVGHLLAPERVAPRKVFAEKTMLVLVSSINRGVIHAVQFAKSFNPANLRAVHVALDDKSEVEIREQWMWAFPEVPFDVVRDEYRDINETVLNYLRTFQNENLDKSLIVVMVEYVPYRWWQNILHNQTALRLRYEIEQAPDIHAEILTVPIKMTPYDKRFHPESDTNL